MQGELQMPRCPRDGTRLKAVKDHGMRMWSCHTCAGLWLPMAQIEPRLPASTARELFHIRTGDPTDLVCPTDSFAMRELTVGGVRIDRCGHCRGLWFDAGELTLVIGAIGLATGNADNPPSGTFGEIAREAGVEIAINGGAEMATSAADSIFHGAGDLASAIVEFIASAISP